MNFNSVKMAIVVLYTIFLQLIATAQVADNLSLMEDNQLLGLVTQYNLKSEILQEDRPVIISLPDGYDSSNSEYPVLYLTDGLQNIWHVVGTLELLTRTGSVPPMIVVGIESTNRLRDFTLTEGENFPGSGGGKKFLAFIEKELIPLVESNYRTIPFRVLEGHSLGGLFAASALMEKPDLFDGYIVMSPSFWWNGEELTQNAEVFFKNHPELDKAVFFGIGTYESGADYGMRKELKNYVDILSENQPEGFRFERKEIEGEGHMSSTLLSNYYGLKFVFADMLPPASLYEKYSDQAFLDHEDMIMTKYGDAARQSAESYINLALHLRGKERFMEAATVLNRSVKAYPFDVGIMSFLGNIYEQAEQTEAAISIYLQAIEASLKYNQKREVEFESHIKRLCQK
jgi:predicted alpha/beta superfamily hydrolase